MIFKKKGFPNQLEHVVREVLLRLLAAMKPGCLDNCFLTEPRSQVLLPCLKNIHISENKNIKKKEICKVAETFLQF